MNPLTEDFDDSALTATDHSEATGRHYGDSFDRLLDESKRCIGAFVAGLPTRQSRLFVLPKFLRDYDPAEIAGSTATLKSLLARKDLLKEGTPERAWTVFWREQFHVILTAMDRPDAHESLNFLLSTLDDVTDPATIVDVKTKYIQYPHIGEEMIGAIAVGELLLGSLQREFKVFEAETQETAARNTFEKLGSIELTKSDGKKKEVAASSLSLSDRNVEMGRIRTGKAAWFDLQEQIDYVACMIRVMQETYKNLQRVSFQNEGIWYKSRQQGA